MKYSMNDFIKTLPASKKALPILSFPCISLLGISVKELISSPILQANGMKAIAERTASAAALSFMDLSVEAECFGSEIIFSEDEVPTVTGAIVSDIDDANALRVPEVGEKRSGLYIDSIKKSKGAYY